jgi:hypothetical protein
VQPTKPALIVEPTGLSGGNASGITQTSMTTPAPLSNSDTLTLMSTGLTVTTPPNAYNTPAPAHVTTAPLEKPVAASVATRSSASLAPPTNSNATAVAKRATGAAGSDTLTMRIINSKRIRLNYQVNDVGPSGLSCVELWYTRDCRTWKKCNTGTQKSPPFEAEVDSEGLYGFTLLARNGLGIGKAPPQPGDLPQVWVEVDLSKPKVQLLGADSTVNGKSADVQVRWRAEDRNLGPRPVTLSYAEKADGPWTPIAANVENTGHHTWQVPPGGPGRYWIRVEVSDLAGNVGMAETPTPVAIDASQPSISIVEVESASH